MLKKILAHKKKLIYIIVAVALAIALTLSIIFLIGSMNDNKTTDLAITKTSTDTLKLRAIEALRNSDKAKAKNLFEQANQQYKELGDTNNSVDTAAQIYLIDHPSTTK